MSELVVHTKCLLIAEILGCLDAVHNIVPPCLSPLKVVQSYTLAHYLHHMVLLLHTHHLERYAINWFLKHLKMIHILVFKIPINRSTRHTFGPILFLLDQWFSLETLPFQFNKSSWHIEANTHNYCFPDTIQRLAHPQHHPNCLTKLTVLFLSKLFWLFLSFGDQSPE